MSDEQNRKLAELLNDLSASLSRGDDMPAISAKLASALSFAVHHFECGERLMDEHGFAEVAAHLPIHACLPNDLVNFSVWCDMRSLILTTGFLQEWWLHHCDSADRELATALRAFGAQ